MLAGLQAAYPLVAGDSVTASNRLIPSLASNHRTQCCTYGPMDVPACSCMCRAMQRNLDRTEKTLAELAAKLAHEQQKLTSYTADLKLAEQRCRELLVAFYQLLLSQQQTCCHPAAPSMEAASTGRTMLCMLLQHASATAACEMRAQTACNRQLLLVQV